MRFWRALKTLFFLTSLNATSLFLPASSAERSRVRLRGANWPRSVLFSAVRLLEESRSRTPSSSRAPLRVLSSRLLTSSRRRRTGGPHDVIGLTSRLTDRLKEPCTQHTQRCFVVPLLQPRQRQAQLGDDHVSSSTTTTTTTATRLPPVGTGNR